MSLYGKYKFVLASSGHFTFVGTTRPAFPRIGDVYLDNGSLYMYHNDQWDMLADMLYTKNEVDRELFMSSEERDRVENVQPFLDAVSEGAVIVEPIIISRVIKNRSSRTDSSRYNVLS